MPHRIRIQRIHAQVWGLLLAGILGIFCVTQAQAQSGSAKPPASLRFGDTAYQLVYQGNPSPGYRQYAYLPKGQKLPYYRNMLMLETLVNGVTMEDAVNAQIEMIEQRKEDGDLTVNHSLIENPATGEYLLDFVSSADDEQVDGIVEWNAYRYMPYTDADGEEGVQIYGYSARGYGADGGRDFLIDLRERRSALIQALASATVPKVGGR